MDIANGIRKYMESHGIKQSFIAEQCGWSRQKTSTIVLGKKKMAAEELGAICDALGVPYDFFYKMVKENERSA